jgi:hypothetical protein
MRFDRRYGGAVSFRGGRHAAFDSGDEVFRLKGLVQNRTALDLVFKGAQFIAARENGSHLGEALQNTIANIESGKVTAEVTFAHQEVQVLAALSNVDS